MFIPMWVIFIVLFGILAEAWMRPDEDDADPDIDQVWDAKE